MTDYAVGVKTCVCYQDKMTHSNSIASSIFYLGHQLLRQKKTVMYPGAHYYSDAAFKFSLVAKPSCFSAF